MKIIIVPDSREERKILGKDKLEYLNVFEFALTGRCMRQKLLEGNFSHLHIADKFVLMGKLEELKERLRSGTGSRK